jgi:hypothetical protein
MPKPFTPWGITRFKGENDTVPATEIEDEQASLCQNLYIVNGGLERRLGSALINTTLGSSAIQGLQWCRIDPALAGAGSDAAETASSLLDPLSPTISANLQLYLRGDQAQGANGAACSSWLDLSGNSRDAGQATGARQPINRDGQSPNGLRRMVEFDGLDDMMSGGFPFGPGVDITNGVTIYLYCNETALTTPGFNSQMAFGCGNSVSAFELYTRTSSSLGVGFPDQEYGSNSGNVRDSYGATVTGAQMLTLVFYPPASATANIKFWKNGIQLGTTQQNWQAVDIRTGYTLGNTAAVNEGFDGYVGAVLVYNTAHPNPTREAIEDWLIDYFEG